MFPDHFFCPAKTTNIAENYDEAEVQQQSEKRSSEGQDMGNKTDTVVGTNNKEKLVQSSKLHQQPPTSPSDPSPSYIRPVNISPLPSCSGTSSRKKIHDGTQILTSSPFVEKLKAKAAEKLAVESRRAAKRARTQFCLLMMTAHERTKTHSYY